MGEAVPAVLTIAGGSLITLGGIFALRGEFMKIGPADTRLAMCNWPTNRKFIDFEGSDVTSALTCFSPESSNVNWSLH